MPPDVQKVLDIAASLAGGYDAVGIDHVRRGCLFARRGEPALAMELYELLLDHLAAELEIGMHAGLSASENDDDQ